ncbi:MAG: spore cortex biosynthesis protein YabQ [Oscillospiraceae bacterium]|nr:spore cortex biosynthesis protein YabQ [Oscillospiraceae bacterium]
MYDSTAENLAVLGDFALVGFALAFVYEGFRTLRVFIPHNGLAVGVEDFAFLCFAGLVTFAYSMELGTGEFRMLFVVALAFGGAVYFLTLGALISFVINKFANALRKLFKKIYHVIIKPALRIICKIALKFIKNFVVIYNSIKKLLKSMLRLVYNRRTPLRRNKKIMDGKNDVIKAKVKKR